MSFIMKIIFATEPIKYPLTGIGRYSLELVKRLAVAREIEELKAISRCVVYRTDPFGGE